jgi:hypothetical protein
MAALRRRFQQEDMLNGSTAADFMISGDEDKASSSKNEADHSNEGNGEDNIGGERDEVNECVDDAGPKNGPQSLLSITLLHQVHDQFILII